MPAGKGKQLSIGLSPEQFQMVKAAADLEDKNVTAFYRDAILEAAEPQPELEALGHVQTSWQAAVLIFLSRPGRETRKGAA